MDILKGPITLASLSAAAQQPETMACIWAHLVTGDLFLGRWILFDSLRNRVFAFHSILLALFLGPIGLLSHLLTRGVKALMAGAGPTDAISEGLEDSMSDESLMQLVDDR